MRETTRKLFIGFVIVVAIGIGFIGLSRANADSARALGPHGGTLERSQRFQFEVVCARDGLKVYPFTPEGKPLDAAKLTGTATFYHPNTPNPWFDRALRPAGAIPGQASASLDLSMGLSIVPVTGAKVSFEITGLSDPAKKPPPRSLHLSLSLKHLHPHQYPHPRRLLMPRRRARTKRPSTRSAFVRSAVSLWARWGCRSR